ncbi:MAG TPA: protein translocase component YidC [Clostridiales bacterium]|nr:protein translocase component YidC [Clostridiales bacterium]
MTWLVEIILSSLDALFSLTGSYGWAIILLTVGIRAVLLPLTAAQIRSRAKMQEVTPKLNELRAKFKNDRERLNRETMELWKKHKVNPLGGCLPLLVQLPFVWAVFVALQRVDYQVTPYFLGINLAEPELWVLPILAGAGTFVQSLLMSGGDPAQRGMLYVAPLMIAWVTRSFPAGLAIYWVMTSVVGVVEHYGFTWIMRTRARAKEQPR